MLRHGIELELFYYKDKAKIEVPPANLPLDGCGAIVELRSGIHNDFYGASFEIKKLLQEYQDRGIVLFPVSTTESNQHKFTVAEYRQAQKQSNKDFSVSAQNIYGRVRRLLPSTVVAVSVQLNLSNCIGSILNSNNLPISHYGLLDTHSIVKALDKEFATEIALSKRVAGEYAIKDNIRLEYRSLPSTAFFSTNFEQRVLNVLKKF